MVVGLALASLTGAAATAILVSPVLGWVALLVAPLGGSAAALAVGVWHAEVGSASALHPDMTDQMVSDLKSVLKEVGREHVNPPEQRCVG